MHIVPSLSRSWEDVRERKEERDRMLKGGKEVKGHKEGVLCFREGGRKGGKMEGGGREREKWSEREMASDVEG